MTSMIRREIIAPDPTQQVDTVYTGVVGAEAVTSWTNSLQVQQSMLSILDYLAVASRTTGSHVCINPTYAYLPYLTGRDGKPVPLYQFVEALDGIVDYRALIEELPSLTYAQVSGALAFLRKLSQFNVRGIDIDELEDAELEESVEFQTFIRKALADEGERRVLDVLEQDGR